MSHADTKIE